MQTLQHPSEEAPRRFDIAAGLNTDVEHDAISVDDAPEVQHGSVALNPDEEVQERLRLVFTQFRELRSAGPPQSARGDAAMAVSWWWAGIGVAAVILLAGIWWLWWRLPKREADRLRLRMLDPKARVDIEDDFRKTVGQALAGIAILGTGISAYLLFSRQQQVSHDLLVSNQVADGFEQLRSSQMVVRLGGIYALEGVMNGSSQYHKPVLEALCAFMREGTIGMIIGKHPATDIQATLTVIGRREPGEGTVDLRLVRLPGANLLGADLTLANLSGADLSGADLTLANLNGADLTRTDLTLANLTLADLTGAELTGAELTRANLTDGTLGITQQQLDQACGVEARLRPDLTLKPCPPRP